MDIKTTFDRIKDDPCYGCKHAELKDPKYCTLFESLYLCHNRKRIDIEVDLLKRIVSNLKPEDQSLETLNANVEGVRFVCSQLMKMLSDSDLENNKFSTDPDGLVCPCKETEN